MIISEEELIEASSKHLKFLRGTIYISEQLKEIYDKAGLVLDLDVEELKDILFFNSLISIAKLDLGICLKNLRIVDSEWEKIYFMKNAHLTINEVLESLKSYNKFLYNIISKYSTHKKKYDIVNCDLKDFRKKYKVEENIKLIRNKAAGHIDKDFKLYFDELTKLDENFTVEMIQDFIKINQKYLEICADLVGE